MKIDPRDRELWMLLSLGLPLLVAVAVLAWGFYATSSSAAIPDPNAVAIIGITPQGNAVPLAPTRAPSTPTPAPRPGYHRVEGVIVDELGLPIENACIAIGPNGCREHSPMTDARGVYFIDFPPADVEYDLHFTKDGFTETVKRLKPTANLVLNIVLGR